MRRRQKIFHSKAPAIERHAPRYSQLNRRQRRAHDRNLKRAKTAWDRRKSTEAQYIKVDGIGYKFQIGEKPERVRVKTQRNEKAPPPAVLAPFHVHTPEGEEDPFPLQAPEGVQEKDRGEV